MGTGRSGWASRRGGPGRLPAPPLPNIPPVPPLPPCPTRRRLTLCTPAGRSGKRFDFGICQCPELVDVHGAGLVKLVPGLSAHSRLVGIG